MQNSNRKFKIILSAFLTVYALLLVAGAYYCTEKIDVLIKTCDENSDEKAMEEYFAEFSKEVSDGKVPAEINKKGLHNVERSNDGIYMSCNMEKVSDNFGSGNAENGADILESGNYENETDYFFETNVFETEDLLQTLYLASIDTDNLKYVLTNSDEFLSEYAILSNDIPVATVMIQGVEKERYFILLSLKEWEVTDVNAIYSFETNDISVVVPDSFKVKINGLEIDGSFLTGESKDIDMFKYASEYIDMPKLVSYRVNGFLQTPKVEVFDADGRKAETMRVSEESVENTGRVENEDGNRDRTEEAQGSVGKYEDVGKGESKEASGNEDGFDGGKLGKVTTYYAYFEEEEMPEDLKEYALAAAKTWDLYNTNDASLDEVEKYVVKDGFYDVIARRWLYSADRTYTSTHTLDNPPFRAETIDEYFRYSEDCFSCHVYLEKIMHLTRNGNLRLDVCDMTYFFVNLDDTDDGIDNPHWCVVDMVSKPGTHPTVP